MLKSLLVRLTDDFKPSRTNAADSTHACNATQIVADAALRIIGFSAWAWARMLSRLNVGPSLRGSDYSVWSAVLDVHKALVAARSLAASVWPRLPGRQKGLATDSHLAPKNRRLVIHPKRGRL